MRALPRTAAQGRMPLTAAARARLAAPARMPEGAQETRLSQMSSSRTRAMVRLAPRRFGSRKWRRGRRRRRRSSRRSGLHVWRGGVRRAGGSFVLGSRHRLRDPDRVQRKLGSLCAGLLSPLRRRSRVRVLSSAVARVLRRGRSTARVLGARHRLLDHRRLLGRMVRVPCGAEVRVRPGLQGELRHRRAPPRGQIDRMSGSDEMV